MGIKSIENENDYQQALARLEFIFDAEFGSSEGDELKILGVLIEKYENDHYHIPLLDPGETIKFRI